MFPSSNQRSGSRLTVFGARLAATVDISLGWGEVGWSAMLTRHRFTTLLGVIKSLRVRITGKRGMSPCCHWRYPFCGKEDEDVRGLGPTYDLVQLLLSWMRFRFLDGGLWPLGWDSSAWGRGPGGEGGDALEDGSAEAHSVFVVEGGGQIEGEKVGSAASWAWNSDFLQHECDWSPHSLSHSLHSPGATRTASSFLAYHVTEFCPYPDPCPLPAEPATRREQKHRDTR